MMLLLLPLRLFHILIPWLIFADASPPALRAIIRLLLIFRYYATRDAMFIALLRRITSNEQQHIIAAFFAPCCRCLATRCLII